MILSWCLILTLVTGISDTFMLRQLMSLQTHRSSCSILTLVTRIPETFMFSQLMFLWIARFSCLILTLMTEIYSPFMFYLQMFCLFVSFEGIQSSCLMCTLVTGMYSTIPSCLDFQPHFRPHDIPVFRNWKGTSSGSFSFKCPTFSSLSLPEESSVDDSLDKMLSLLHFTSSI